MRKAKTIIALMGFSIYVALYAGFVIEAAIKNTLKKDH